MVRIESPAYGVDQYVTLAKRRAPVVCDHVRRHVDEQRRKGLYRLTGSATGPRCSKMMSAQPLGGEIYSWREANGRKEVDAIIETPEGWSAFEIKLTGDPSVIDDAAKQLIHFAASVDQKKHGTPAALSVITATGGGGRRPDGVHVVPIAALGP